MVPVSPGWQEWMRDELRASMTTHTTGRRVSSLPSSLRVVLAEWNVAALVAGLYQQHTLSTRS